MIGERPDADAKAPEEYIFVCKLNPVTTEEDLETIFCRCGFQMLCPHLTDRTSAAICILVECRDG
jgi:peptidyl-prolyl cis-trans isomerase-like 4